MATHFSIVYNTCYRTKRDESKRKSAYHELQLSSSDNPYKGHIIKFYLDHSTLRDIVAPHLWKPEGCNTKNDLTDGKRAILIVNEQTGKCAKPTEFDMLISDFVGNVNQPGRLFVIMQDENLYGMHIDSFSFSD